MTKNKINPLQIKYVLGNIINHPINKTKKIQALIRFIKWQIGSRLISGSIIYDWIDGAKFIVEHGQHGLTENIYNGLREFEDMGYVLHILNQDDIFIDIGANVGSYTILSCKVKRAKGICFEPVPSTFSKLRDNLKINNLLNHVKAYNIGIAEKEGELFFTTNQDVTNHLVIAPEVSSDNIVKTKVVSLDTVLKDIHPTMIKIDVEGFETLVVAGALETLKKTSLHSIIIELNGTANERGFDEDSLVKKIQSFGFVPCEYDPFNRKISQIDGRNEKTENTLFCRQEYLSVMRKKVIASEPFHVFNQVI